MKERSFKKQMLFLIRFWALVFLGALATLIFPPFEKSIIGYGALIAFLSYLFYGERSGKNMFWTAYAFGFAFFAVGFIWINNALLVDDSAFKSYIPLVILAIGSFFGLFWAVPACCVARVRVFPVKALLFAVGYVFFEWVRSFIFTGFPWNLLGTALAFHPALVQGAAYIGTYGLSLLLLLFCSGVAFIILGGLKRKFYKSSLLFILLPTLFIGGMSLKYRPIEHADDLKIRLVQPSIPQTYKWHPALLYRNFRQYIELSREKSLDDVDIVVWGETASPYFLDRDEEHLQEIRKAIPQNGFLVTGVLRIGYENGRQVPYNSLYVIDDNGDIKDYYDKAHLVPFGEFLPFRKYLPDFMKPVANVVGDLGRGEKYKNLHVKGLPLMGGAVCYESIFPKEVVNQKEKPEILFVLANDGWYGDSAGPYQHLVAAQMRAVEEGITIVRSANTGISAVIFPNGEIKAKIGLNEIGIADVALSLPLSYSTFYGKFGNIVPLSILLVLLFFGIYTIYRCRKKTYSV